MWNIRKLSLKEPFNFISDGMSSLFRYIILFFFLILLLACVMNDVDKTQSSEGPQSINEIQVIQDTLINLTELEPCDILVKPNMNWFAGSAMVNGGRGFGHALLVIEGGRDTNTMKLLEKVRIFESQARDVPEEYELREGPGFLEGNDFRFANTTFGMQNRGFRYRLRFNLTHSQRDSILNFVLAQDYDISSWRSQKRLKSQLPGNLQSITVEDKKIWYCSLLIWEAFYEVLGIDLDSNGGIMVFPNDLIASPYFDNDSVNTQKRVRF